MRTSREKRLAIVRSCSATPLGRLGTRAQAVAAAFGVPLAACRGGTCQRVLCRDWFPPGLTGTVEGRELALSPLEVRLLAPLWLLRRRGWGVSGFPGWGLLEATARWGYMTAACRYETRSGVATKKRERVRGPPVTPAAPSRLRSGREFRPAAHRRSTSGRLVVAGVGVGEVRVEVATLGLT